MSTSLPAVLEPALEPALESALDQAVAFLCQADALVVTAGAGMGIDSGLPDFRGPQGFWRAYPALGRRGLLFADVASPRTFRTDPALAWGFYGHRLALYRRTRPHAGFGLLERWADTLRHGAWVYTSNVDGQFQRAGWRAQRVAECHGAIAQLQCSRPCGSDIWSADDFAPEVDEAECQLLNAPPVCPHCGALARPNILMFGDGAWVERRSAFQLNGLSRWVAEVERPLVIEIGAGTAVPSVRHFSEQLGLVHGARLVRINPHEPQVPRAHDVSLPLGALEALQALDTRWSARVQQRGSDS
jgi:NAD-dependent SIR2 family protein deacetylase